MKTKFTLFFKLFPAMVLPGLKSESCSQKTQLRPDLCFNRMHLRQQSHSPCVQLKDLNLKEKVISGPDICVLYDKEKGILLGSGMAFSFV